VSTVWHSSIGFTVRAFDDVHRRIKFHGGARAPASLQCGLRIAKIRSAETYNDRTVEKLQMRTDCESDAFSFAPETPCIAFAFITLSPSGSVGAGVVLGLFVRSSVRQFVRTDYHGISRVA